MAGWDLSLRSDFVKDFLSHYNIAQLGHRKENTKALWTKIVQLEPFNKKNFFRLIYLHHMCACGSQNRFPGTGVPNSCKTLCVLRIEPGSFARAKGSKG